MRFRRESGARVLADLRHPDLQMQRGQLTVSGRVKMRGFDFELTPGVDEGDGLPAEIPFTAHASLVNIDYLRLRDDQSETVFNVTNVLNPQTRHCMPNLTLKDDGDDFPNRFVLLTDSQKDCELSVKAREGDLFLADDLPDALRQSLRDLVTPIYNHFALTLGSEPGITFVAWRPDSTTGDFRFERNWGTGSLVLFNGRAWQNGLDAHQKETLWDSFALEQVVRRLGWLGRVDDFTQSAVDYLLELAKSSRDRLTNRNLTAQLPNWIARCARFMDPKLRRAGGAQGGTGVDCGMVVQFVYDAVARAQSSGKSTVNDTWRKLLNVAFKRNEFGVQPQDFIAASTDARRMSGGLVNGSMDWPKFIEQMATIGVQLRIKPDGDVQDIEVVSLAHFQD